MYNSDPNCLVKSMDGMEVEVMVEVMVEIMV